MNERNQDICFSDGVLPLIFLPVFYCQLSCNKSVCAFGAAYKLRGTSHAVKMFVEKGPLGGGRPIQIFEPVITCSRVISRNSKYLSHVKSYREQKKNVEQSVGCRMARQ